MLRCVCNHEALNRKDLLARPPALMLSERNEVTRGKNNKRLLRDDARDML